MPKRITVEDLERRRRMRSNKEASRENLRAALRCCICRTKERVADIFVRRGTRGKWKRVCCEDCLISMALIWRDGIKAVEMMIRGPIDLKIGGESHVLVDARLSESEREREDESMSEPRFVYVKEDLAVSIDLIEGFRTLHDGSIEVFLSTTDQWGKTLILEGQVAERFKNELKAITIAGIRPKGGPRSTPLI